MRIIGVPSTEFLDVKDAVAWHFNSFEERSRGKATASDLAHEVMNGKRQCWLAVEDGEVRACALSQVKDGRMRTVTITHCAGRGREDWQEAIIAEIREWAKHIGAEQMLTVNRPGYTKFLRGMGFKETHRVMELEL